MNTIYIDNNWVESNSSDVIAMLNPSDGTVLRNVSRGNAQDIDAAVKSARHAFETHWADMPAVERGRLLYKVSQKLIEHQDELTQLESDDCGKPTAQARADAIAIARYFEFYAGACDKFHGETIPYQSGFSVLTWREPHGVTGHIVPWNYPLQIFGRCVAAALAAGNTCVVKPGEDACLSILRVVELAREAGLPPGVLNLVTGYGHEAGDALVKHPDVDHISFTGSPAVGTLVTQVAAVHHTPVTLELGGKSPQIVFSDADLDELIPTVVRAIIQNTGQTCSAGTRLLVERPIYEKVISLVAEAFSNIQVGPASQNLDCGPLIRKTQLEHVKSYVQAALNDGLKVAGSGNLAPDAPEGGFYHKPMLFRDVPASHKLAREEVFGPILVAIPFDTEAEAVEIANGTDFGLVASVWTNDGHRQHRMARRVKAGQVYINNYGAGGGIELPFGGIKASGHGREKGFEALYGFTVLKTVAIKYKN
ncbi:aldehyde dehydrogenase family protein [Pollutimonas harenae]|uniref:Aldehyde dehydrogenase family protein n=1 Tax=Pollutimonas harenae TaxID=657015 RepID=A0A853GVK4_9BURK|nr:aldehyde dehydrogenase family protein [Pollutimonas harenae]NYT84806.1 aldehyde dehydrogenase family protein [Pollutimonas harenae]TEA72795.1 aldehyde dehydrogenase family protein [Pollutimonas harenae]